MDKQVNYFEVHYSNCFGEIKKSLIATKHNTPDKEINFNWNGNKLINYYETSQYNYSRNIYTF
ncbi:MAG: hypothetical protein PHD20_02950 [Clostridia bacterium]|nr:hypothetical protein [Clostridia bacterium]